MKLASCGFAAELVIDRPELGIYTELLRAVSRLQYSPIARLREASVASGKTLASSPKKRCANVRGLSSQRALGNGEIWASGTGIDGARESGSPALTKDHKQQALPHNAVSAT